MIGPGILSLHYTKGPWTNSSEVSSPGNHHTPHHPGLDSDPGTVYDDGMYEFFEHTADLGIRVLAADRETLFVEAAQAMFSAIVEDLSTVKPEREIEIILHGQEMDYLLFDWLKALLYYFDAEHLLLGTFEVKITDQGLTGKARGEPLDRSQHLLEHEVKAITYHGLRVEQTADGWLAEVIVDI